MKWNIEEQPIFFPNEVKKIYEKIYRLNRLKYTNWIGKISRSNKNNIDWWMTKPTLRNPYTSNLLNYITVIETLEEINNKNIEITTSSNEMKLILFKYFKKKSNIKIHIQKKDNSFFQNNILSFFKCFFFQLFIFIFIKFFVVKKKYNKDNNYTLIDTFLTLDKRFNNELYPIVPKKNDKQVLFVPTIIHTLRFYRLIKLILKMDTSNYLFKEHYLTFKDLFFCFFHFYRKKKFLKNTYYYKKYNLSKIVNEEINSYDNFNSIITGILNFNFFKNISNFLSVKKSINWFENQVIDRGWNLGFRTFFKKHEKNSFGYQNFTRHYNLISFSPSEFENKSKVTPEKIIVISKFFHKISKEFFKKQISILGPTNRFKNISKTKIKNSKKRNQIILILSGIREIDRSLIKFVLNACLLDKKFKVYVKDHPIMPLNKIISLKNIPTNLIPVNQKLDNLLKKSFISITSGPTSAIQESYIMNNFLILPKIEVGTEINASRLKLNPKNIFIVKNTFEFLKVIKFITKNNIKFKRKKSIFFEQVNKKNIKIFY